LNLSGGYIDGKYGDGIIGGQQVGGNQLIGTAKWTMDAGFTLTAVDNDQVSLTFNPKANYTGRRYFNIFQDDITSQPGFWLVNGNIGLDLKEQGISVSVWGRNLLGKRYINTNLDIRGLNNQIFTALGDPRTYGVDVKFTF